MKYFNSIKRYAAVPVSTGLMLVPTMVSFAADAGAADAGSFTTADWTPVMEAITKSINVTSVIAILGATIAAGIGLVIMWWAARKLVRALMSAFRKGRVSL